MPPDPVITVHGRPGCHLCDEAMVIVAAIATEMGARVEEIDIERDDELHRRYLERIPVISLDDEELYDYFVDEADLRARLARRGTRTA